jgi:hypothetical protein
MVNVIFSRIRQVICIVYSQIDNGIIHQSFDELKKIRTDNTLVGEKWGSLLS